MRKWMMVLAAIAAAVSLGPAVAGAGTQKPTEVTFEDFCGNGFCGKSVGDDWMYLGKVNAARKCRVGRRVEVYWQLPGTDQMIGFDRADSRGNWMVREPDRDSVSSTYYAKAPKLKLRSGKVCAKDKSPTLQD